MKSRFIYVFDYYINFLQNIPTYIFIYTRTYVYIYSETLIEYK